MTVKNKKGFSLIEVTVVIVVLIIVIGMVYSAYLLSQRAFREGETTAELNQNGRVILERVTREIRQAKVIITDLSDEESGATSTIEFQDGHDLSYIHYVRYFWDSSQKTVKREVVAYYYSVSGDPDDPNTYMLWNAVPPPSETLAEIVLESYDPIGEYVEGLGFWGDKVINMSILLQRRDKSVELKTKVFGRNF